MTNENYSEIIIRIEKLEKAVFGVSTQKKLSITAKQVKSENIDFSINIRTFVKKYSTHKSGPKKFTLLLAYFTKGEIDKTVALSEVKKYWGKMSAKSLLGNFNMFYPVDAKTRGWVDSKEHGTYHLTKVWKEILQ
jgi:hypothetical protein